MRFLAIARRIHVFPARDQQTVQAVEHPVYDSLRNRLWRQEHGDATHAGDCLQIHFWQEGRLNVPHSGLRLLEVGGQPDDRWSIQPLLDTLTVGPYGPDFPRCFRIAQNRATHSRSRSRAAPLICTSMCALLR